MQLIIRCSSVISSTYMMCSVDNEEDDWFDDLEETVGEKVKNQGETPSRKRTNKSAQCRALLLSNNRQRPARGLVEQMMKCVITDSTLEHGRKNYQMALTPRTERKYQAPLLTGRRVPSFRCVAPNSPTSSPRRPRVPSSPLSSPRIYRTGHERCRMGDTPVR